VFFLLNNSLARESQDFGQEMNGSYVAETPFLEFPGPEKHSQSTGNASQFYVSKVQLQGETGLCSEKRRGVDGGLLMSILRVYGVWIDVGTFFALNGLRVSLHGMESMENESLKTSSAGAPCTVNPLPFHNPYH